MKRLIKICFSVLISIAFINNAFSQASFAVIEGTVLEKSTGLPLPGVNVIIEGTFKGTVTDPQGHYVIADVEPATYSLVFSFISFESLIVRDVVVNHGLKTVVDASLAEASVVLNDIVIVAKRNTESEISVVNEIKNSTAVVNGISAQAISRFQDSNASEVVKKSTGVTLLDDRFIIIRGLSQRYNNVWLNNTPVPGTETDSRAFAFDLIPASQIDNLLIYKSPSPELPADFSGGFVKVTTRNQTEKNSLSVQYGLTYREGTTFMERLLPDGNVYNYLALDNGGRSLPVNFPESLKNSSIAKSVSFTRVMDNNWLPVSSTALPDQKFSLSLSRNFKGRGGFSAANFTSLTYGISSKKSTTISRRYGIYNTSTLSSSLYNDFTDEKDSKEVKLAILHNWIFNPSDGLRLEVRNLLNQFGVSSYSSRTGTETYSGEYQIMSFSDQYYSRTVYSGQLAGVFESGSNSGVLSWTAGYSRSSRNDPDRRIVTARRNMDYDESSSFGKYRTEPNDIRRLFQKLEENILSGTVDFKSEALNNSFIGNVTAGWYGEYRDREFSARGFSYQTGSGLNASFYNLPVNEMFNDEYISSEGIYIYETSNKSDSYDADNLLQAVYVATAIKAGDHLTLNAGVRVEYNKMTLDGYESDGTKPVNVSNAATDFFPSLNALISLNQRNQVRLAYGRSVNRPEFREVAPYVYYDFDAFSYFEGNPELENAYIENIEFRYEFFPEMDELFTAGVFYKYFNSPVEVTYYETGGSLQYTYTNARSAYARGFEIELRKAVDLPGHGVLSLMANASMVDSRVSFNNNGIEKDRPMQGQSPYIVNAGLFYVSDNKRFTSGVTFNRTGKRITAVGQVYQNSTESIPDVYEMPVNLINLTATLKIRESIEISFNCRNILNEKVEEKQFIDIQTNEVSIYQSQVTRSSRPGRQFGVTLAIKL